jgi:hypothetical protein
MRRVPAVLLIACSFAAAPLAAQVLRRLELGATVHTTRFRTSAPSAGEALSGVAGGAEARLTTGRFSLKVWYLQGRLAADTGIATPTDLVDGGVMASVRPVPWAWFAAGPHLRAYVVPAFTERWMFWEARGGVDGVVIDGKVRGHLELWTALSATGAGGQSGRSARGGEAGLTGHLPGSPLWLRVTYAIDRVGLPGGGVEALDGAAVTVGYGGR